MQLITVDQVKLITINEAMRFLSVGRTTIYRLIKEGSLESVTIGSSRRISMKSVEYLSQKGDS